MKKIIVIFLMLWLNNLQAQSVAAFNLPDTVCANQTFSITNTSSNTSSYNWNFCSTSSSNQPKSAINLGALDPLFDYPCNSFTIFEAGNYYMFVINNNGSTISRLDFGASLLNTPTPTNLGTLGNVIPWQVTDIYIQKENNNWYGVLIGGSSQSTPSVAQIIKLDFGNSITNTPTAISMGNIGNLDYPVGFQILNIGGNFYGFTINVVGRSITRFDFGNSINNTPTAINFGNLGGLNDPVDIDFISDQNNWYAFISNQADGTITRLDFGNSLLNTPTGVNLGNPDGIDGVNSIILFSGCNGFSGIVLTYPSSKIGRLTFPSGITGPIKTTIDGNFLNYSNPTFCEHFQIKDTMYVFVVDPFINSMARLSFIDCDNPTIAPSSLQTPPALSYSTPGIYQVSLTIDKDLHTQSTLCKSVVVIGTPTVTVSSALQTICVGQNTTLTASGAKTYTWAPAFSLNDPTSATPIASPTITTTYSVTGTNVCGDSSQTFLITVNESNLMGTIEPIALSFPNDTLPQLIFKGYNGVAPYTFSYKINDDSTQFITTETNQDTVSLMVPIDKSSTNTYKYFYISDSKKCGKNQNDSIVFEIISYLNIINNLDHFTFKISPNPFIDLFTVQTTVPSQLTINDITGNEVYKQQLNSGSTTINGSNLKPGIYFISFIYNNTTVKEKIIKY